MERKFEKYTFAQRLTSMLKVDFRRMFTSKFFYIMLGISLVAPILILVMTSMMDGTVNVDPTTGKETVIEGFDYVWQAIATPSNTGMAMSMDLVSMCNVNMFYFAIAVLVCIFVSDDFRSGYCKNLFTSRSNKSEYVISKTLVLFVGGALMIIAYFIGAMLGGAISGVSFALMDGVSASNIVMCMLSKVLLVSVFIPIFLVMSVVGKSKLWLSMILAFGVSMLLFTMVPMISPLDSTLLNVIGSLLGGILFSVGIGYISNLVLKKNSIL